MGVAPKEDTEYHSFHPYQDRKSAMSKFGSYKGDDFLKLKLPPRDWLVENIMRVGDSVILVGTEKSGKSLLTLQLICSLTSCHPFLDRYNVIRNNRVTYVQLEGELSDAQDRLKRMIKSLDIDPTLFHYMFYPPLRLQEHDYTLGFIEKIEQHYNPKGEIKIRPDVVIIDPIYFAFTGSLSNDEIVRKFIGNLRILKDRLNCTVILVHHTHKQRWSYVGDVIDEGDEAIFGSKFLKAWADHTMLFIYDKKKEIRTLSCNTQRSGDIVKQCYLKLVEPNPLYFEEMDKEPTKEFSILALLQKPEFQDGLTSDNIMQMLEIRKTTFYKSIKDPLAEGVLIKVDDVRPLRYRYCREAAEGTGK